MANNALLVTLCSFAALLLAYRLYGRFLAGRIFRLDPTRKTPAHTMEDGVDYVPTKVPVLFGHHFASIAGLGPILGPAIAVIWGWVPAVIWVVVGSIFMGAVHDLGALTVSLRFRGRSIGDVCRDLVGPRARLLFLLIIFFAMSLAMGAFVNAISSLFVFFKPDAIIPSFGLIFIAMGVGVAVYRFKIGLGPATLVALGAFAGLIVWGAYQPISTHEWNANPETKQALIAARDQTVVNAKTKEKVSVASPYGAAGALKYYDTQRQNTYHEIAAFSSGALATAREEQTRPESTGTGIQEAAAGTTRIWVYVLLGYGFIAAVLPVWLLLQPRDYINSFQLYFALGCMVLGLCVAALVGGASSQFNHIDAPTFRANAGPNAPPWIPFLFVTIACGAISGFHSLVSSGTTVRQLDKETDALPIGYGAMLTEGALAVLVIMACVAGLGASAWSGAGTYGSWGSIKGGGLGTQLNAVITGGANFLSSLGIGLAFGTTFLAVTIVSFALTTLDSATRLLRFNVEEIFKSASLTPLANRYVASLVAIAGIAAFGLMPAGKSLWVMFGTTNQLLAGLTLLTVSLFLYKLSRPYWYTLVPMVLMLTVTIWAMTHNLIGFFNDPKQPGREILIAVTVIELGMSFWLLVEAGMSFSRGRGGLDFGDDPDEATKGEKTVDSVTASSTHAE